MVGEGGAEKLHWLKFAKTVPKNKIWTRKQMIKNLINEVYLLISNFLVESLKVSRN